MHSLDKFEQEFKQRCKEVCLADYERGNFFIVFPFFNVQLLMHPLSLALYLSHLK
jgi:hypothetical protein